MSPMTSELISYWQRLPAESPAVRKFNFILLREDVRAGRRPPESLVTMILGDVDDEIVHAATCAYLEGCALSTAARRAAAVEAVVEWIRRGLALNRGSVFAALLGTGETVVHESLAALRLSLTAEEVAVVCGQLPASRAKAIETFLREWADLVEESDDPTLSRQFDLLAGVLDGRARSAARPVAA